MVQKNHKLRLLCKGNGIPLWKIAELLKISEQTLIRQWRKELTEMQKKAILKIIEDLKDGESNGR